MMFLPHDGNPQHVGAPTGSDVMSCAKVGEPTKWIAVVLFGFLLTAKKRVNTQASVCLRICVVSP